MRKCLWILILKRRGSPVNFNRFAAESEIPLRNCCFSLNTHRNHLFYTLCIGWKILRSARLFAKQQND